MADLLARFRLVDEMSTALDDLARKGLSMSDSMERAGSDASTAFDRLSRGASSTVASVDGVASSLSGVVDETGHWTAAIGSYDKEAMEAIYTTEELVEAGSKVLKQEMKDLSSTLEDNKEQLESLEKQSGKTGQAGADAMETLSNALTSAGVVVILKDMAGAFLEASEAAAEFETSTMKISTIADPTRASISAISSDIMSLSRDTGQSVNELSEATYSAISASVDTASVVGFTATATKLAAGGFTSSSTAVDVLTTALNAYGLEANRAESISDMLITTQNLGKTTVDGLAASVGKVIPLASAYGVEMDNLSAAYAELTKGGIATAEAGTYLKSMLNELGDSGSTVSTVLKEQTGSSFAQLMDQGYSLGDVMDVLGTSVHGDAGAFNELWSSSEAGIGALSLIQKYDDLASKADRTAAEEKALVAVNKQLASSYPEIAAQMSSATISTEDYVEAMKKAAEAEAEEQRQQQAQETYIEALQKRAELTDELAKAQENVNLEQQRMDDMSGWDHFWIGGEWDDLEAYQTALEELEAAMAENDATIAEIEQGWEDLAEAEAEAAEATVSYEDAVNTAVSSVQADIDALCEAYDAAYESARNSIDGQIGLFDTMVTETELSITDMQAAFDSQIEYLNTYSENLRKAAEYGFDEGLVASLSDGSEESAGYLNAIIEKIEALGDSSAEAQAFVDDFNSSFQEVEAAKDEFATTVTTMETDFDEKMAEIEGRLDEAIDNMNMEADAAAVAKETMEAYTQSIRDGTSNAVSAAGSAANAVSVALSSSYSGGNVATVAGHANGTTYAEDAFIAGEEGPELILGKAGSTVFPADETDRIINAVTNNDDRVTSYALSNPDTYAGGEGGGTGEQTKHITLEIAGGSPIEVNGGGGTSKEEIVEVLVANLRPALLNLVKDEIFEEGDGSYEH